MKNSPGRKFRFALKQEKPLKIVGTINAYVAIMAERIGFKSIYLSGAGTANISYGLPDLALTTLDNILEDTRRITSAVEIPLLVDIDTGWGNSLMIARTIKSLILAGAAAVHIEDQVANKRCGHRPGTQIVSCGEMVDRIKAAVDAKTDPDFVIMARSDAYASEGMDGLIQRAIAYRDAGADMFFPEALQSLDQYKTIKEALDIPILANITEFGKTPLFTYQELLKADVDMALYPLTISRLMHQAAKEGLQELKDHGSQVSLVSRMQTREELYKYLDYYKYENKLDAENAG